MKEVDGEKMYTGTEIVTICGIENHFTLNNWLHDEFVAPDKKAGGPGRANLYSEANVHRIGAFKYLVENGFSRAVASAIINDPAVLNLPKWRFKQIAEFDKSKVYYNPALIQKSKRLTKKKTFDITCLAMAGEVAAHMKELFSTSDKATEFDKIQIINLKPVFDRIAQGIAKLEDEMDK